MDHTLIRSGSWWDGAAADHYLELWTLVTAQTIGTQG